MAYVNTPISFYCKEVSMMLDFYVTETPFSSTQAHIQLIVAE